MEYSHLAASPLTSTAPAPWDRPAPSSCPPWPLCWDTLPPFRTRHSSYPASPFRCLVRYQLHNRPSLATNWNSSLSACPCALNSAFLFFVSLATTLNHSLMNCFVVGTCLPLENGSSLEAGTLSWSLRFPSGGSVNICWMDTCKHEQINAKIMCRLLVIFFPTFENDTVGKYFNRKTKVNLFSHQYQAIKMPQVNNSKKHTCYPHVHCSSICNSHDMEST